MIVVATHAVFLKGKDIYGPPHAVSLYLNKKKIDHLFIKHRLWGDGKSVVEFHKNGTLVKKKDVGRVRRLPSILHYLYEMYITVRIVLDTSKSCDLFIGVDPLNVLAGNILRFLGKVKKSVYFSADFAIQRFDNSLLNKIYHSLDTSAMQSTDQTWSVSKRIVVYRKKHGLLKKKNLLLPNAPFFDEIKRLPYEKIDKNTLVIVSALEKGIAFELLLDSLTVVTKKISDIKLFFIGSGTQEKIIRDYIQEKKLEKHTKFFGALPHDDMFKVLAKSGVGIALYDTSDPKHFRYFSDPMKVRDYLASGLPVIISGNSGINEDLENENVGFVVELKKEDIVKKLLSVLSPAKHKKMRENALVYAKKYDTYELLEKYFKTFDL
jgi:glycosyltransferase involved in cell wall biosynthesis